MSWKKISKSFSTGPLDMSFLGDDLDGDISNGLMLPHLCLALWGQLSGSLGLCSPGSFPFALTCEKCWASGENVLKSQTMASGLKNLGGFFGVLEVIPIPYRLFCNFDNHVA